jgi:hypothetical protein
MDLDNMTQNNNSVVNLPNNIKQNNKVAEDLSLYELNKYTEQINKLILKKKKFLINKQKQLALTLPQNKYLEQVKNDYEKYHNYISHQKKEQIRTMNILKDYINDIIVTGNLTENGLKNAKKEQDEILLSIDKIKEDLDELINI